MAKTMSGTAASPGIAIAKGFRLETLQLSIEEKTIADVSAEIARFEAAVRAAEDDLEQLKTRTEREIGKEQAGIFAAHLLVLKDPEVVGAVKKRIESDHINAEAALQTVAETFIALFENLENEYMRERAADVRDVTSRVLAYLMGRKVQTPAEIDEEVILVAHDLTPSDTAQLNRQFVKGFITEIGGRTSHSAIMSRSMGIPAVVGVDQALTDVKNDSWIILDGISGEIVVDPSPEQLEEGRRKLAKFEAEQKEMEQLAGRPTVTADGERVELAVNIGHPRDVEAALQNGAEGIGLYRTEFLYMDRDRLPDEEEQFESYKSVLEQMAGKPVVIRTLDIGGDKELSYMELPKELNPFLGMRAIRLCFERQDVFRVQLRALLRASVHGNLKIMFPMIAVLEEFRLAKQMLEEEKAKLREEGVPVSEEIEVGIMVELPSTAMHADAFAKETDFFSIGTNDLIQYTFAADRMNENVSYLYQPYHPAVLKLIANVIRAAHREGKWTGMCGEAAGDSKAIPLLLGLGLDEFSMSAGSLLPARKQLLQLSQASAAEAATEVLNLGTSEEVLDYVSKKF